jgi:predicted TPR repeat methyltransferase
VLLEADIVVRKEQGDPIPGLLILLERTDQAL